MTTIKCSDINTIGAVTGRTSGLQVTLANPKPGKIGTEVKALLQNTRGTNNSLVSFDISAEEMTIVAAYNSAEYCDRNWVGRSALASPGAQTVLLGRAADGTDFHTVAAKAVGIAREHSKTLSFAIVYGSGNAGCCNLLRPLLPGISEAELKDKVTKYVLYLKGKKNFGKFADGQFSDFFNFADKLIKTPTPTLPFGRQTITNTLRNENCGNDYYTSKMNWSVQATGSAILDFLGYEIDKGVFENGLEDFCWFQFSVHDQLSYNCDNNYVTELADIIRSAYAKTWREFFKSLHMSCPIEVQRNIIITQDVIDRKEINTKFPTDSAPSWLVELGDSIVL